MGVHVNLRDACRRGMRVYASDNDVVLTEGFPEGGGAGGIPTRYISWIEDLETGETAR